MTDRLLVYPLVFLTLLQLGQLIRQTPRWLSAPIVSRGLILFTCGIAWLAVRQPVWVGVAWIEFGVLILWPVLAAQRAMRWMLAGEFQLAARAWQSAARLNWSRQGQVYRQLARALQQGKVDTFFAELNGVEADAVWSEVALWRLWWATGNRNWSSVIASYEAVEQWGSLSAELQARLAAARAYAELGLPERATRCLVLVAASPRAVGALAAQLWMTRVVVAALAGDSVELERLLAAKPVWQQGFARFAAAWRGRCAGRRGDRATAGRQLSRALALTPARLIKSRQVLTSYLEQPESGVSLTDQYRLELARLQETDLALEPWRMLMPAGRPPRLTMALVALLAAVFTVDAIGFRQSLFEWGGNVPFQGGAIEWWRPATAIFLHANLLHLTANMVGLWMFGAVSERTWGRGRMLAIFLGAGVVANIASASMGGFDVSVGASGGVFGLVAAFGVAAWRLGAPVPSAVRRRLLWLIGAMVASDFIIGLVEAQIDGVAHAGGFMVGLVLAGWLSRPRSRQRD